jgi:dUTP pyrophosphatase
MRKITSTTFSGLRVASAVMSSESMTLKVTRLNPNAILPAYAHPGDAGLDLCAAVDLELPAGETRLVPTGIAIELPAETEAQVRPRSGLALSHSVTVLNTPGTIDEGYRGEIGVILINHGRRPFQITAGMRIAQLVIQRRWRVDVVEATELTSTSRGSGGFGSTGS